MLTPKPRKACFFIGHRDAPPSVCPDLEKEIERHIMELGVSEFYVGNFSTFDRYAAEALSAAKERHPEIHLYMISAFSKNLTLLVPRGFDPFPYYPAAELDRIPKNKRLSELNRVMVRKCEYLIAYVQNPQSNSSAVLHYAEKYRAPEEIVNLAPPPKRRRPRPRPRPPRRS